MCIIAAILRVQKSNNEASPLIQSSSPRCTILLYLTNDNPAASDSPGSIIIYYVMNIVCTELCSKTIETEYNKPQ